MLNFVMGALVGIQALGTIGQAYMQHEASQDARRAQRVRTSMEVERNRRASVQAIRQSRIQGALIAQSAQNTGSKGSGALGAISSISSQRGAVLGQQALQTSGTVTASNFLASASKKQDIGNMFGTASKLASLGTDWLDEKFYAG